VFVNAPLKRKLTPTEFESQKSDFLQSADMKQVILALHLKQAGEQVVLVTEETAGSNDNKLFKKIPAICKALGIDTLSLPDLLAKYDGLEMGFQ
jgi:hypothetical protein